MDKLLRLHTYVVDQFFERRRFLKAGIPRTRHQDEQHNVADSI